MGHAKKKDGKRSDALEISPAHRRRLHLRGFGRGDLRRAARLPGVYFAAQRKTEERAFAKTDAFPPA